VTIFTYCLRFLGAVTLIHLREIYKLLYTNILEYVYSDNPRVTSE